MYGGIVNYFPNYSTTPREDEFSTSFSRIGNNVVFEAIATDHPINYTNIPFGSYLFRSDLKNLYYYPVLDDSYENDDVRIRCESQGPTTVESLFAKFADYIDLAASVRDKEIFTTKMPYDPSRPELVLYAYVETIDINEERYDKVNITHAYVVDSEHYNLTIARIKTYRRHLRDGDFEYNNFAQDVMALDYDDPSFNLFDWAQFLVQNALASSGISYYANIMEVAFNPSVRSFMYAGSFVCPEIDHLPVPSLTEFLPNNYTEYQLIFENPVCVKKLMKNLADVLNLTSTHPERVAYSGIEKIEKEWAVDVIMPTDLGEILSTAVVNRDVKKSGYELVGKIVRMVSKKSGK